MNFIGLPIVIPMFCFKFGRSVCLFQNLYVYNPMGTIGAFVSSAIAPAPVCCIFCVFPVFVRAPSGKMPMHLPCFSAFTAFLTLPLTLIAP